MNYLLTLPLRIVMIPIFWFALIIFAVMVPFICLFGSISFVENKIKNKGKK
jgi:hypothetical protein